MTCVFPSVVLEQTVQTLYMAIYINTQHRSGRMELLRCCFGWQRLPLDVCVCDNRWGGACNAASGHRCVCQLLGTTQCHATAGHACTCKSIHDAHACLAKEHVCVCPPISRWDHQAKSMVCTTTIGASIVARGNTVANASAIRMPRSNVVPRRCIGASARTTVLALPRDTSAHAVK